MTPLPGEWSDREWAGPAVRSVRAARPWQPTIDPPGRQPVTVRYTFAGDFAPAVAPDLERPRPADPFAGGMLD